MGDTLAVGERHGDRGLCGVGERGGGERAAAFGDARRRRQADRGDVGDGFVRDGGADGGAAGNQVFEVAAADALAPLLVTVLLPATLSAGVVVTLPLVAPMPMVMTSPLASVTMTGLPVTALGRVTV